MGVLLLAEVLLQGVSNSCIVSTPAVNLLLFGQHPIYFVIVWSKPTKPHLATQSAFVLTSLGLQSNFVNDQPIREWSHYEHNLVNGTFTNGSL